jgi:sugar phosphate permease
MFAPGLVALSIASLIIFTITDRPTDRGFNDVEIMKKPKPPAGQKESTGGPSATEILMQDVLSNPWVWLFGVAYFFTYMIRQGTSSWFVHYLMNVKGITDLPAAAAQVSGLEIGGFFGAISAGSLPAPHFQSTQYPFCILWSLTSNSLCDAAQWQSARQPHFQFFTLESCGSRVTGAPSSRRDPICGY